jgi:hypothetical protein
MTLDTSSSGAPPPVADPAGIEDLFPLILSLRVVTRGRTGGAAGFAES